MNTPTESATPSTPPASSDTAPASIPVGAAKGDDDAMSSPSPPPSQSTEAMAARWQDQLEAAQLTWRKLSLAELTRVGGLEYRLARLLHDRYALSRGLANRQARDFFSKHMA